MCDARIVSGALRIGREGSNPWIALGVLGARGPRRIFFGGGCSDASAFAVRLQGGERRDWAADASAHAVRLRPREKLGVGNFAAGWLGG